ncbi:MAG: hypothetical protein FJ272_06435 [Planctomycetes bacterium]|nr:hypothetical protein [Planctomycetota bacterium]
MAVTADSYLPDTTYADMILTRKFHIGSFRENVVDFGSRINWNSNPTEGEAKTVQWNAVLNRHFHFTALYRAYWATGDEKYAKELADQIVGWVEDCPMLLFQSGNSPYHYAWETLNTAVRLQSTWPETFAHCLLSPSFTDHALVTMVKSMAEQARHLVKWPTSGNWLTAESLGIYVVGTLLPEFKEAPGWRKLALERLYKQLDDEVYPDGLEYEVALGYNLWVLSEYIQILEIAKLNDALGEIPADYRGRIEKMFNYLMYDSMPDGVAVGLNDSGNAPVRAKLIEGYRYFPHRHDFPYVASNGLQGQPPERTSYAFPYTGHYVMRSGWDKDARFLHLDGGLFGYGHQHEDKLHFVVAAYGKQLLLDAGNYTYDASRWRRYVLSTRGHNTILVDGQDQNRRRQRDTHVWPKPWTAPAPPTDTRFVTASGFDYAIGFYKDGYGPQMDKAITHTRQIYFAKPDYWLVLDTLTATDGKPHTCDSLFHIAAAEAAVDPKTKAVTTSEKDAPNLALVPLDDASLKVAVVKGKTEEPVQGWSHVNGPWRAVPTAIFSKEWTERTQLLYVVHPSPPGATATPAVTRLDAKGDGLAVCVERPGRAKDFFLVQSKPGTLMEAGDVVSDAEVAACSQRRSASEVASPPGTGVPDYERGSDFRLCMAQGTKLKAGACGLTLSKPASISVESLADGLYLLNFAGEAADTCELQLAEKATPQVFRLDKNLDRKGVVATSLRFPVEPHGLYEINFGSKKSVKEVKAEQAASAAKPKVAVDFPLRPQAPLPPTKGVKVVVQAEDFSAQGGGAVTVTDKKVNAQGKAFLNWDKPGHWLEWKFRVPQDGEYRVAVKCCSESPAPQRAVVVDGAFPSEPCQRLDFPSTGGWSNERDDWKLVTLSDPKTQKPLAFHLRAGEHTLRLINLQDSMNLDFLVIFSPDQPP